MAEKANNTAADKVSGQTYAIFSGHSGGHLYPALAFAESLRKKCPQARIHLISSKKARPFVARMAPGIFDEVHLIREFPLPSGISLNLVRFLLELPLAFFETWKYFQNACPDICIGFGSYVSYPGIVLGSLKKIPCLIHEQNLLPGKATRSLVRHADCVAVSFEPTFASARIQNRIVTGLPLRSVFWEKAHDRLHEKKVDSFFHKNMFQILVAGGSQGAHRLNEIFLSAIGLLSDEEKAEIAVNHITGKQDLESVAGAYKKMKVQYEAYSFFDGMHELYAKADMAVSRAGASSLHELALFGLPAVIVPYPHAGSHQQANADYYGARGAALVKDENGLSAEWLAEKIQNLKRDPAFRYQLSKNISELASADAAERLVMAAEELLRQKRGL
jgi:UDP-N-acetylglucosamine--N-acetylmuramyl-(pentapeptide) pyrophosphoryl-undecaprenol N-acetylglucosamine transferase